MKPASLQRGGQKRFAPKARTGCTTCKKRKIKCDETKPACLRCRKTDRTCEGYAPPKVWLFEPSSDSHNITEPVTELVCFAPRIGSDTPITLAAEFNSSSSALVGALKPPPTIAYGSTEESRALSFYLCNTAVTISNYSHPYFWKCLVPRLSWSHPAIKHGLIASALLTESLTTTFGSRADSRVISHYNTAIHALTTARPSTDIILMSAIIFFVIDTWNGATDVAHKHITGALEIAKEWERQHGREAVTVSPSETLVSELIIPVLKQGYYMSASARTATNLFETDPEPLDAVAQSSSPFTDIGQVISSLHACVPLLSSTDQLNAPPPNLAAYLPHLKRKFHDSNIVAWPSDLSMLLHHFSTFRIVSACNGPRITDPEMAFDSHTEEMKITVAAIQHLLATTKIQTSNYFKAKLGLIAPLFMVGMKCRDSSLRRKTAELLKSMKRKEGRWDSCTAAKIIEEVIEIEERGLNQTQPSTEVNAEMIRLDARLRDVRITRDPTVALGHVGPSSECEIWLRFKRRIRSEASGVGFLDILECQKLLWDKEQVDSVTWPLDEILEQIGYQERM